MENSNFEKLKSLDDPQMIESLLEEINKRTEKFKGRDVNEWLLLTEIYQNKAGLKNLRDNNINEKWLKFLVKIYEMLALDSQNSDSVISFECSAMRLRTLLINQLGPEKKDFIRDPTRLEEWFFAKMQQFKISLRYLEDLSSMDEEKKRVENLGMEKRKMLRHLKNCFACIDILLGKGFFAEEKELASIKNLINSW